jgi:hypothetical protein
MKCSWKFSGSNEFHCSPAELPCAVVCSCTAVPWRVARFLRIVLARFSVSRCNGVSLPYSQSGASGTNWGRLVTAPVDHPNTHDVAARGSGAKLRYVSWRLLAHGREECKASRGFLLSSRGSACDGNSLRADSSSSMLIFSSTSLCSIGVG